MKKILLLSVIAGIAVAGCKKKMTNVSEAHHVSYPTILISSDIYYSIPVGGTLPTITATAYDSFYREVDPVIIDQSTLDNSTPGLYAVTLSAKNKYGMTAYASVYIGVTSADPALDLSGWYMRNGVPERSAYVTKLGTGLFMTSNAGGADTTNPGGTGPAIKAVFVVTSDTTLSFGTQLTDFGTLSSNNESLTLAVADTELHYAIVNASFGTQVRTFIKQ